MDEAVEEGAAKEFFRVERYVDDVQDESIVGAVHVGFMGAGRFDAGLVGGEDDLSCEVGDA